MLKKVNSYLIAFLLILWVCSAWAGELEGLEVGGVWYLSYQDGTAEGKDYSIVCPAYRYPALISLVKGIRLLLE